MSLTAAFAAFDITPAIGMDIPGGFSPRPSTGVSMPLQARAAALENLGSGLIIIGVDAVSLNFDTANAIKAKISAATGLAPRRIAVVASHTHSGGPANAVLGTDANPAYLAELVVGAAQAGITAWRQRQPATPQPAPTTALDSLQPSLARQGRQTPHQPRQMQSDMLHPATPADPEVAVIAVRDLMGTLGMIANFTCHSTILSQRLRLTTAATGKSSSRPVTAKAPSSSSSTAPAATSTKSTSPSTANAKAAPSTPKKWLLP